MTMVTGKNGITYRLDTTPIGSGGEGDVFHAYITKVAKVYKPGVMTKELENKLEIMIANPPSDSVLSQVAWPLDTIYDDNGQCKGFIMSELSVNAELGEIYKYPSTLPISVHQKINIAQNICVVISEVHKAGYIFGDFNPRNIGLDKNTGLVSFLDTDTYHVVDPNGETTYRCNVCAPGYAAPELLEKCSNYVVENPAASQSAYAQTPLPTFTQETDNFALAIHIFKLLMNGYTPFGGIIETASVSQSSPGVGDATVRRDSYCYKPGYKPQSVAIPDLGAFPDEIVDLFTRAFIAGKNDPKQRPSAVEWHLALSNYAKSLVTCQNNVLHHYDEKNDVCPYCEADKRFGAVVYGDTPAISAVPLTQTAYAQPPKVATRRATVTSAMQAIQKARANTNINSYLNQLANDPTAVKVTIVKKKMALAAGAEHSAAIDATGQLWAWGSNNHGQLGDGIGGRSRTPIKVLDDVVSVSAGEGHTMAITSDTVLLAWGNNDYGQLGNGTFEPIYSPIEVLTDVIAVSAGYCHTLAITSGGKLWAWGNNEYGQLGDGTYESRFSPVVIIDDIVAISAGYNESIAINANGDLFIWDDVHGLEDDDFYPNTPTKVENLDNVVSASVGSAHVMALTSNGDLWTWGWNEYGQLGVNIGEERLSPVRIMENVISVSAGHAHSTAITVDGILWVWGLNDCGQLGNNTKENQYASVKIMDNVAAVSAGANHTMAITTDGVLWSWGSNASGKLGNGSFCKKTYPIDIIESMMII